MTRFNNKYGMTYVVLPVYQTQARYGNNKQSIHFVEKNIMTSKITYIFMYTLFYLKDLMFLMFNSEQESQLKYTLFALLPYCVIPHLK